jgi:glycosyltransferase involved in cell wall biosynthesis
MNDSFPPSLDGVANTVVNYANILTALGSSVTVATPAYPDVKDDYPYQVLRYPSFNTTKLVGYRAGMPLNLDFLTQFKKLDVDIIHSHCPFSSTILARTVRDMIKKPVIMTYHTKFDYDIKRAFDNRLIQDAAIKYFISNVEAVDEVWAVSKGAGENLKSLGYRGDYIVMDNGVDFDRCRATDADILAFKKKYQLKNDRLTFLFVGRIMWYKGLKIIIDALAAVKAAGLSFQMIFVGGGMAYQEVVAYVNQCGLANCCVFTGPVYDREELRTIYSSADLFLFPSCFDTNGIVVREAAACGCPSMLIKDSCAAEGTTDARNTLLIAETAAAMAARLCIIGNNPSYYRQLGANASEELYISWQTAVEKAYQRYQIINENYHYHKRKALVPSLDDFYKIVAMFAQTSAAMKKMNEINQNRVSDAKNAIENYMDRYL